jgi:hypothetical protein
MGVGAAELPDALATALTITMGSAHDRARGCTNASRCRSPARSVFWSAAGRRHRPRARPPRARSQPSQRFVHRGSGQEPVLPSRRSFTRRSIGVRPVLASDGSTPPGVARRRWPDRCPTIHRSVRYGRVLLPHGSFPRSTALGSPTCSRCSGARRRGAGPRLAIQSTVTRPTTATCADGPQLNAVHRSSLARTCSTGGLRARRDLDPRFALHVPNRSAPRPWPAVAPRVHTRDRL